MKIKIFKYPMLLLAAMILTVAVNAQENNSEKDSGRYDQYDIIKHDASGKTIESVQSFDDGKTYRFDLADGKLLNLYVDGVMIPADKYSQYEVNIGRIREQIRINRVKAQKDQAKALESQVQAKMNQQQAMKAEIRAKIDQEVAVREQADAKLYESKSMKEKMEADEDVTKAKVSQEQALKNAAKAELNQEQAVKAEAQAKIAQERALEDQRLLKSMISDLVKDGIIVDERICFQ